MKTTLHAGFTLILILAASPWALDRVVAQTTSELDGYWAAVSRTVEQGDFEGYAALYHEDAVVVSGGASSPIAATLAGWEPGFVDTKSGRSRASVEFRFSQRLNDATTAHETGIFHYTLDTDSGEATAQYVHFEALLVKKDGWKMVMEYQQSVASVDEWNALR